MANQLQELKKCTDKRVVLHIISAHGFSLVKGSIVVHATLMNQLTKTPSIFVDKNELKFDTKCAWFLTKATLKQLRMANTSIKVECFHIPPKKEPIKLGYFFLKLKGAQVIYPSSNDRVESASYKLIGSKNSSYSLLMSLQIEDYSTNSTETSPANTKRLNSTNVNDLLKKKKLQKEYLHHGENVTTDLIKNDQLSVDNNMIVFSNKNDDKLSLDNNMISSSEKNKPQNSLNYGVQQNATELENVNDREKIIFNKQMDNKEELLKEFNERLLEKKTLLEGELVYEISKCKKLTENLDQMVNMLKEREAKVAAKELELFQQEDSIMQRFQSDNSSTIINEYRQKINDLETKLNDSENTIVVLKMENKQLENSINSSSNLQIQLGNKIIDLLNKCEETNESLMFYKERWIVSVRKINQMYPALHENKPDSHTNNRQNIQNVLTNQMIQRQKDEKIFKQLRNDLNKLLQEMS